jgi:fatty acid desaturase
MPARREFLTPWHGVLNVLHVLATHALLVAWFWLGRRLPLALYVPLSVLAALIHQRAMSEWIHEAAHGNLLPWRRWNDRLGDALAGVWFALRVSAYRTTHLPHHALDAFFVDDDADTRFLTVGSRRELIGKVLADLSGLTVLRQYGRFEGVPGARAGWLLVVAGVQATLVAALWRVGRLDAWLLYYGTLATAYPLLNRLRTYGQHATIDAAGRGRLVPSGASRTIDAGLLDRIVFTSPRLMYHDEHHREPHLPWRALRSVAKPCDDPNRWADSRWAVMRAVWRGLD